MRHNKAEARAVLFSLAKVREFKLDQILFLLDSLEVIRAIKGNEDWTIRSFVMDIRDLAKSFELIRFRHLSRALNRAAHDSQVLF